MRARTLLALILLTLAFAALSPPGAAAVGDGAVLYSLNLRAADGTTVSGLFAGDRQLTSGPEDHEVAVSPDGGTIAFARYGDLYVVGLRDGGIPLTEITSGPDWDGEPRFSPDGRRILFTRAVGEVAPIPVLKDLYLTDLAGGPATRLTHGAHDAEAVFSPDGEQIVFVRRQPDGDRFLGPGDLYSIRPGGLGLARLTRTREYELKPHFSRAGIVFARRTHDPVSWWVMAMRRDGSGQRRLIPGDHAILSDVSADGRRLLYRAGWPLRVRELGRGAKLAPGSPIGLGAEISDHPILSPSGTKVAIGLRKGILIRDLRRRTTRFLVLADAGIEDPVYRTVSLEGWQPR